jgi:hypothetical protein
LSAEGKNQPVLWLCEVSARSHRLALDNHNQRLFFLDRFLPASPNLDPSSEAGPKLEPARKPAQKPKPASKAVSKSKSKLKAR